MMSELPEGVRAAIDGVVALDGDFAGIEAAAGPLVWRTRPPGFAGLLQTIMGQQISSQAAAAIWGRLAALDGARTPAGFLLLGEGALRAAGLSRPKVSHCRALAAAFLAGALDDAALAAMDDQAAVAALSAVRGLGPWTAEVHLLFALGRLDVFPAGDVALAASVADLKRLPVRPAPRALRAMAALWAPYRGVAARLLWHHWRFRTGRPSMDEVSPNAILSPANDKGADVAGRSRSDLSSGHVP